MTITDPEHISMLMGKKTEDRYRDALKLLNLKKVAEETKRGWRTLMAYKRSERRVTDEVFAEPGFIPTGPAAPRPAHRRSVARGTRHERARAGTRAHVGRHRDMRAPTEVRRKPAQKRGELRVQQILDACQALILEMGVDAVTTNTSRSART